MKKKITAFLGKVIKRADPLSIAALLAYIIISMTVASAIVPLEGEKEFYNNIIRFHVLANSDSDADQELKLYVRDKVTEYTTELLKSCTDIDQAKDTVDLHKEDILTLAKEAVLQKGFDHTVTLETGFEIYPRRTYGNYTFPAGEYYSLRIKIGKAEGKNWWCVLFPPMCLGSASVENCDDATELQRAGFTENDIKIVSDNGNVKKEIRFFFLDLVGLGK